MRNDLKPMRNASFLRINDRNSMRNTILYFILIIVVFCYKQGRRIKNYCSVKVVTNIFHPIRLLVFSDSYFLLLFYPSLVW